MSKRQGVTTYEKGGRYYADFRRLGGKLEALKPSGEHFATCSGRALQSHWVFMRRFARPLLN